MELIVHIGMPKTATTTLQKIYFPLVAKENQHIEYHGVFQPRGSNKTELYRVINKYINTGINLVQSRELLKTYQQKNKVIHIVSEEMIVVSEENTSWRTKTSRLIELLNGINYTLLVSVREPLLGSFSYYVERYLYFKNKKISYKQAVNSEESIDIYKSGR